MDLERIREWLIQNGISEEELDQLEEPIALSDLGETLKTTLENDNQLGLLVTSFFVQFNDVALLVMDQQQKIMELESKIQQLEGGN